MLPTHHHLQIVTNTQTCYLPPHSGIPQVPSPPTGSSNTPGSVLLTLSTKESGTTTPQKFSFFVNITLASGGITTSRTLEAKDYSDREERQFTVDGLTAGGAYLFSAQAQNQFGVSDFSGNSFVVRVATSKT